MRLSARERERCRSPARNWSASHPTARQARASLLPGRARNLRQHSKSRRIALSRRSMRVGGMSVERSKRSPQFKERRRRQGNEASGRRAEMMAIGPATNPAHGRSCCFSTSRPRGSAPVIVSSQAIHPEVKARAHDAPRRGPKFRFAAHVADRPLWVEQRARHDEIRNEDIRHSREMHEYDISAS